MAGGGPAKGSFGDINITPLTDVFLVLLVVVIIAAPSMQSLQKDIIPPKLTLGDTLSKDWLVVEVTKDNKVFIDGSEFQIDTTTGPLLIDEMRKRLPVEEAKRVVVVRGDAKSKSDTILSVLDVAKELNCTTYIAGEMQPMTAPTEPDAP